MPTNSPSPWLRPNIGDQEGSSNLPDRKKYDGHPNPDDKSGASGDAEAWYRDVIQAQPDKYDTNLGKDVWLSWFPAWNPQTKKFKSQKVDGNNQPFTGDNAEADKPTDCPGGTQAWGDSMCLPPGDKRLLAGQPAAAGATTATAAAPVTEGKAGTLTLTGNKLVDMLLQQFHRRTSL